MGDKQRGKKTERDKGETRRGRETEKTERARESLWDCRGDCDHASWISISKQNKYSSSRLLLLFSSHKQFQVPCHPFPLHDLYLLASSLLGSPSPSHLLRSPRQLSFIPSFFCSISHCISSALTLFSASSFFFSLHSHLYLLNLLSLCLYRYTSLTLLLWVEDKKEGWQRRWSWWPLLRSREQCGYFL